MPKFLHSQNLKDTIVRIEGFFSETWRRGTEKLAKLYTGPGRERLYACTAIGAITVIFMGGLAIHMLTGSDKLSDTAYAVNESLEFTTKPEASSTDSPLETSTVPETTTSAETTAVPETMSISETTAALSSSVIPVSELDIAPEDSLTDTDVQNRNQTNHGPALNSPLKDISSASDGYTALAGFTTGIDVSKHQGTINWTQVRKDGISFAFIKVAGRGYETGKLYYDNCYKTNLKSAAAAGIQTGAYFFSQATTVQEAREEASMMIEALKGYQITYPVVFDWETASGYRTNNGISKGLMTAMAETFCSMLENAGYRAMIYANTFDFERFESASLTSRYASWLARYPENYDGNGKRFKAGDGIPSLDYPYQIWQYSSTGRVAGISGDVDMNVGFIKFSGSSSPSVPMVFELPKTEYVTKTGQAADLLENVKAYNCAGILATSSMQCTVTNSSGASVSAEHAVNTAGKYTVTYSLKDFTGYIGRKEIPLYVQAAPVISLDTLKLTVKKTVSYEGLISIIEKNLISSSDFMGTDLTSKTSILYPEHFYKETDISKETTGEMASDSPAFPTETSGETGTTPVTSDTETFPETTSAPENSSEHEESTTSDNTVTIKKELLPGTYTVTYSVTDSFGLDSTAKVTLVISD